MPGLPAAVERPGSRAVRPHPISVLALTLSTIGVTGFSLLAFLALTALETFGGYETDPAALMFLPLLALPGAALGSVLSRRTRREWPFWVGVVVTMLPVVLAFVLPEALDPSLGQGSD